ncbi:MAG: DUF423 domain-containing protein [Acidobacteriota bacterium]|nr:DUF423 domain-containing protein [Acidobacteriota bacterium]
MNWAGMGAGALCLAVVLGAFGAHGLRERLDAYSMGVYERAVFYHFIHGLGLLLTPLLVQAGLLPAKTGNRVAWLLLIGIVLFSGSLYVLAISGARVLGAVTPLGGLAFIVGWGLLAAGLFRARKD